MKQVLSFIIVYCLSASAFAFKVYQNNGLPVLWDQPNVKIYANLRLTNSVLTDNIGPLGKHWNEAFAEAASYWTHSTNFKITVIEDLDIQNQIPNYPCPNLSASTPPEYLPIAFSNAVCTFDGGQVGFTGSELAVTQLLWDEPAVNNTHYRLRYAGIYFNQNENWAIYDGAHRANPLTPDFRRIAAHELGHVLGLDHDNTEPQNRLLTEFVGDISEPQTDDILGIASLYGGPPNTSKVMPGIITSVSSASDFVSAAGSNVQVKLRAFALPGGHIPGRARFYMEPFLFDPSQLDPIAEIDVGLPVGRTIYTGQALAHLQPDILLQCDRNVYYYAAAYQDTDNPSNWIYSQVRTLRTPLCPQSSLVSDFRLQGLDTSVVSFDANSPELKFDAIYSTINGDIDASGEMLWSVFGFNADLDDFGRLTLLESSIGEFIRVNARHRFLNLSANLNGGQKLFLVTKDSPNLQNVGSKSYGGMFVDANRDSSQYEARGGIFNAMQAIQVARNQGPILLRVGEVNGDGLRDMVVATNDRILIYSAENYTAFLNNRVPLLEYRLIQLGIKANSLILEDVTGDGVKEIIIGAEYQNAKPRVLVYQVSGSSLIPYRQLVPGTFGSGGDPYANSSAYQMKPIKYLNNRNELLVSFDGTASDPRGIAVYTMSTGQRRAYYDIGPKVSSVSVSDDGQFYGIGLKTTGDNKPGKGYNNDLNSTFTKTQSNSLYRLVLQDSGANEFIELNNQSPPNLNTTGESTIVITDLDTNVNQEVLLAVSHPLGSLGTSYIQVSNLSGNQLARRDMGENINFKITVDNLNNFSNKEIISLDLSNEKIELFNPNLQPVSEQHESEARAAFVSTKFNTTGSRVFVSNIDNDPYKEILILDGHQVRALDSQVLNTQFTFNSAANNTLTDVITADTNMDMAAEIILVTVDEIQVQKAAFGSNTPPIIANIAVTTEKNTTIEIPLFARDSDGDSIDFSLFSSPNYGSVSVQNDRAIARYTPRFGAAQVVDKFFVSVTDPLTASAVAEISVTITGEPDPPQTVVEQGRLSALFLSQIGRAHV